MIARILEFSLRQRAFVLLATAILIFIGIWSAARLSIDALPDITNVQVQINTEVPALAPEEIEKLVTFPLETELSGVPGATEMRSLSKFGLSQITLVFADGTDIYRARQLVAERLQNALEELPHGLIPKLAPISTGLGEIYFYSIDYAPNATNKPPTRREQLTELKLTQDYVIKPMIRTVPGVAEVNAAGGYEKQFVVMPRPEKLREANLSFDELAAMIGQNVENAGGGVVVRGKEQLIIRSVGRVQTTDEIANIPVKVGAAVQPIRVKDLAEVSIGSKIRTGTATENGEESVIVTVMMLAGENSRVVAVRVREKLAEIQAKLPPGIVIESLYDRSELVNRTIHTVERNLAEGALLVIAVLFVLLGNWRAALIVTLAIPLSFLFALAGMNWFGISGNLMSLGAVDFGLIIDGAVVIVENILRQLTEKQQLLQRKLTAEERIQVVLVASKQIGSPMFFGVLIITIVYLPILSLAGIEGKMFHPMALTVMLALGGALVLALTLMPVLCSFILRGPLKEGDSFFVRHAKKGYASVLVRAMRFRWGVVLGAIVLFGISVFVFQRLGAEFMPRLNEGSFVVQMLRPASISLEASLELQEKAERTVRKELPEVTAMFGGIGTPEIATDPMGVNLSDTYMMLKPRSEWRRENGGPITPERLKELIGKTLDDAVPGQELILSQPIEMRFNELMEGVRADISVKIFGNDYDTLENLAIQVKGILEKIPGADEVEFESSGRVPMLELQANREALARYNLQSSELNKAIATALGGQTVGVIVEGNHRFDLVVRMAEKYRDDVEALRDLPVRVGETGILPLHKVADFKTTTSVDIIRRDSGQRRAAILVNLEDRDVQSFVEEAQAKVGAQVKLPEGFTLEFGGQFRNLIEAKQRLAWVVPSALLLIFVLIFMAFNSVRQALLIYTGIPLAVTGGVFALWARGMPFSITAAVGFIALSGIAVLNGVVLVSYFNYLRDQGKDVLSAVTEGSLTRLRPVLMTALVAALGFVPMAISTSAGAEVQRPLATVVIGGILSSTFLTLVLLPVLYAWVENRKIAKTNT
jgi:heavy metal efflux system protein